ncbi:MAG TPA: hypothetical protein VMT30_01070 [Candidatus Saccharimonadia bacterium]|nr:hypothetical protein [Candidatus Saccharimonadia bacterium]
MTEYEQIRRRYRPPVVRYLLIAESPPPAAGVASSRQFYRAEYQKPDDRLYANTMRAVFAEAADAPAGDLEAAKAAWLGRFRDAGFYMIEALETSLEHEVTKPERRRLLAERADAVIARVRELATAETKLILIKSNVYDMLAGPLRAAGFVVLNEALLDYPGRFIQRDYREKLAAMVRV